MFCWSTNTRLLSSSSSTTRATRQIVTKQVGTNKCAAGLNHHHHYQGQALLRCSSPGWPVSHNTTSSFSSNLSTTASPPFLPGDTDVNDLLPRTKNGNNGEHNINNSYNDKHARFFFWSVVERRKQLARYSSSSFMPAGQRRNDDDDAVIDFTHNVINNKNNDRGNSSIDMTSMVNATDHTSSNNNDNYNFNNRNRTNEKSSRSSPSSLSRFSSNFNNPLSSSKLLFNHQYQLRQYLSSTTIFSSSDQLSSSMMMSMPSLSSPLRLCSSSSSSSSPSAESADNGNKNNAEKNNDDEIDVASLADSAKNILQDQKIAPLILFETIGQVVGPDLVRIVSDFEKRSKVRVDLSLARSIRSMSAIAFYNEEFEGDVSRLKSSEYAELVDAIYRHHAMVDFLTDPRLDLVAKLNVLKIITVFDWYNTPQQARGRAFDVEQTGIINDACAALYRKAEEENKRQEKLDAAAKQTKLDAAVKQEKLEAAVKQEKLETTAQDLERVFQRGPLTPGKSHRHTIPFAYGALARDAVMDDLVDKIESLNLLTVTKEKIPIFASNAPPRQGKTRFCDELGHNKHFYAQLNGGKANVKNTFIFNVTMNSNWEAAIDPKPVAASAIRSMKHRLKNVTNEESVLLLCGAERELCRRIVGAAVGIYTDEQYQGDKEAICEAFIEARDCYFKRVCRDVQQIVAKKGSVNIEDSNFVLIFDEITNLEEFFDKYADRDDLKAAFYSMITPLIGPRCLVFLSGFSEAKKALSVSGRELHSVKLSPISSVSLRRELHTMKSKFFQLCAKNSGLKSRAIYYFELVKSAPGLLGTLLEKLQGNSKNYELEMIVERIPRIERLKAKDRKSMSEILQLKSVLLWTGESSNTTESNGASSLDSLVNSALELATKNKVADCSFSDGVKDLHTARLEPLFVEAAKRKWPDTSYALVLDNYWTQLDIFSAIESRFVKDGKKDFVIEDDLPSVFHRFRTQASDNEKIATRLARFMQQNEWQHGIVSENDLRGCFFEDAIATGLLAQRQFRLQAMSSFHELKEILPDPSSALREYLHGSTVVCSIRPSKVCKGGFPQGRILWNPLSGSSSAPAAAASSSLSSSSFSSPSTVSLATSIIEFDGHFPCVDKNDKMNGKNDVSSEQCDSLDCVLVPRSLQRDAAGTIDQEVNPLVDIIVNERFSDNSLVQFWIDAKHRKEERFEQIKLNTNNINFSLSEIARRATVEDKGEKKSNIRHIVHIIITPFRKDSPEAKKKVERLSKLINKSVSLPPPLKSYTVCFVSPDDLSENKAFENLVSQPIALTIPLMEQQMQQSWINRLPTPSQWWSYNATVGSHSRVTDRLNSKGYDESLLHKWCPFSSRLTNTAADDDSTQVAADEFTQVADDFTQWRRIRFNGDCAIGIGHLLTKAGKNLAFKGDIAKEPHRSMEIPFGCILEALSILPPRAHGTSYCEYNDGSFRFNLRLADSSSSSSASSYSPSTVRLDISLIGKETKQQLQQQPATDSVTVSSRWLLDHISVGHILRFDHNLTKEQMIVDYEECDVMSKLWKKKLKDYRGLALSCDDDAQLATMTCSDLWNMSLGEFAEVFMVRSKDSNSKVSNKSDEDVSKEVLLDKLLKCDAVELSKFVGSKIDDFNFKI